MTIECDHTVGRLTQDYDSDEGAWSRYDLAMDFASDEVLAVYVAHHEMAKGARSDLSMVAKGLRTIMQNMEAMK